MNKSLRRVISRSRSLKKSVLKNDFVSEIYVYPTPRIYEPLENFKIEEQNFKDDTNIYIHIPFCEQICSYCGYLKMVDDSDEKKIINQYVNSLKNEIELYSEILKDKNVKTFHIGGGTPSLLSNDQIFEIVDLLKSINPNIINTCEEISIETTPIIVVENYDKFKELKEYGFNRVSMGVQSIDDDVVLLTHRKNNLSDISIEAIENLKKLEFEIVVIDLMIGIENQTVDSFKNSVNTLVDYKPDTIEFYALGVMPNTKLHKINTNKKKVLMTNKDIYKCYEYARKVFKYENNYIQDCHNRYSIPNKGSFLQEDYVFEEMDLIAFGAGSRTYLDDIYYRNSFNSKNHKKTILNYMENLNNYKLDVDSGIILSDEEKMRRNIIYNIEEFDLRKFKKNFGIDFKDNFNDIYNDLLELEFAIETEDNIILTDKGLNYRDLICYQFFSDESYQKETEYRYKNI